MGYQVRLGRFDYFTERSNFSPPGIYIGKDRYDVPPEFRGIGIRIEDDLVINADGEFEVLTAKCVKEVDDLLNVTKEF